MKKVFIVIFVILIGIFFIGLYRTWFVLQSPFEKVFVAGSVPDPSPDGFYNGTITEYHGTWKGKNFNAAENTGVNIFLEKGQQVRRYQFKTYTGKGLQDPSIDVLKIDYNIPQNPFWARIVLDEIVQTKPGHYLGKLHVRLIPGLPFTLGYFKLQQ